MFSQLESSVKPPIFFLMLLSTFHRFLPSQMNSAIEGDVEEAPDEVAKEPDESAIEGTMGTHNLHF